MTCTISDECGVCHSNPPSWRIPSDISYHLHCPLVSLLPQLVCAQFAKILTFSSVVRISETVFLYHHYPIIILLGPHSLLY